MPQQPWELYCCIREVFPNFAYWVLPPPVEMLLGGIKYSKSTIRNQSITYPNFFINGSKMMIDEQPTGLKNGGFLKTSQLHNDGSAYI
jgi:hypothetical protein